MKKICTLLTIAFSLAAVNRASAQTNIQVLYDFGSDRQFISATIEGFYADNWGDTFFFVDQDLSAANDNAMTYSPGASYFEIARNINFWQDLAIAPLSLHLEYNGGHSVGGSFENAFLAGVDCAFFSNKENISLNVMALFKYIDYSTPNTFSKAPLQLTTTWSIRNLFGLKGLEFCGFADLWWEEITLLEDHFGVMLPEDASMIFITEPQLWYNVGELFGCKQLKLGGELELSYNFGLKKGFWCRPCAGLKWDF